MMSIFPLSQLPAIPLKEGRTALSLLNEWLVFPLLYKAHSWAKRQRNPSRLAEKRVTQSVNEGKH